jgi:hypothetical protein
MRVESRRGSDIVVSFRDRQRPSDDPAPRPQVPLGDLGELAGAGVEHTFEVTPRVLDV